MTHQRLSYPVLILALLIGSATASAAESTDKVDGGEAKEHFTRGLQLEKDGDHAAAVKELKAANAIEPSRLLLYHIAMAYVAMDKAVEAADALDAVLSDGGPLKGEYLKRARAAKQELSGRLGLLDVKVNVPAAIDVDGFHAGDAPLKKPLRVTAGEHTISATAPGYKTVHQPTTVAAEGRADLSIDLEMDPSKFAQVVVASPILDSDVLVDDQVVGKTPLDAPLKLAPGKHTIELKHPGYMDGYRQVTLAPSTRITVAFNPDEDESDSSARGRLVITGQSGVRVAINGRPRGAYRKPISLPVGRHMVTLAHPDFEPMEREVNVSAGSDTELEASMKPSKIVRAAEAAEAKTTRNWGIASIVTGGVFVAGSVALIAVGQSQLPSAQDKLTAVQQDATTGDCRPERINVKTAPICNATMQDAQDKVNLYKNLRLGGIIGGSVGVALIGVGVAVLVMQSSGGEKPRGAAKDDEKESFLGPLVPVFSAGPQGATFGLRGQF
jgi:hypothetical protein